MRCRRSISILIRAQLDDLKVGLAESEVFQGVLVLRGYRKDSGAS